VVDVGGQQETALRFDPRAAGIGAALLELQARAATDPILQLGWINRRVEQLEFLDTRAVRWQVSIDFTIPKDAPCIRLGRKVFRLVPIASLAKANLVAFNLRDEQSAAVWMPTSRETNRYIISALVRGASRLMNMPLRKFPPTLVNELERIVSEDPRELRSRPPALLAAAKLIDAEELHYPAARKRLEAEKNLREVRFREFSKRRDLRRQSVGWYRASTHTWDTLSRARADWNALEAPAKDSARRLMENPNLRNLVQELAQNFIVHVGLNNPPGTRRIIKLGYEGEVTFAHPEARTLRLWQSLGWRCWQVTMPIGGSGGSYHLEVTAPPGVDVVGITAEVPPPQPAPDYPWRWRRWARRLLTPKEEHRTNEPWRRTKEKWRRTKKWWQSLIFWEPIADVLVAGYLPRVHINPPHGASVRYRAAIFVRVSRPGWLTASLGVAFVIGLIVVVGIFNLKVFFTKGSTAIPATEAQAGVAALLLLALLGVFATMLLRPGEHPLASKLLRMARFLILLDVAVVLVSIGYLVLHQHPIPETPWTVLMIMACAVLALFAISWLAPVARPPRRE
jgi:hypothetical protein